MYKDKVVSKNVKIIFLSMCDVKVSLTFTSLSMVHIWNIYDFKIEVVPFIIHFSTDLTTVVKFEIEVEK
jgi:hypothetical protein